MKVLEYPISQRDARTIAQLREKIDAKDDRELIDNAITILQWAVEQVAHERQVASLDTARKTYRVLQMRALQHAAKSRRAA